MAVRIKLKGAQGYCPIQQGGLDSLCGLYAAINAICVVLVPVRPLRASEIDDLMRRGIHHLYREQKLKDALVNGMARKRQLSLTRVLLKRAYVITGHHLVAEPFFGPHHKTSRVELLQVIESSLRGGAAVIVCLGNTYEHYTVIVGCSLARLSLADSDGLHWLPKAHVGSCRDSKTYRHCIRSQGAFKIILQK